VGNILDSAFDDILKAFLNPNVYSEMYLPLESVFDGASGASVLRGKISPSGEEQHGEGSRGTGELIAGLDKVGAGTKGIESGSSSVESHSR
jgi:hypothetical protein